MSDVTKFIGFAALAAAAFVVPVPAAYAQAAQAVVEEPEAQEQQEPLVSVLEALIVDVDAEGNETFREAETVTPGEVIHYKLSHTNQSGQPLTGFMVQGRVPDGTFYVGESATGPDASDFQVLIEGEEWQGEPAYKTIINDDGEEERVLAGPEDYQMIRWVLAGALADETTVVGEYRVRVRTE